MSQQKVITLRKFKLLLRAILRWVRGGTDSDCGGPMPQPHCPHPHSDNDITS